MSPIILAMLLKARRDAFTYELTSDGFSPMRAVPFTTPLKAFLIFRAIDRTNW